MLALCVLLALCACALPALFLTDTFEEFSRAFLTTVGALTLFALVIAAIDRLESLPQATATQVQECK